MGNDYLYYMTSLRPTENKYTEHRRILGEKIERLPGWLAMQDSRIFMISQQSIGEVAERSKASD